MLNLLISPFLNACAVAEYVDRTHAHGPDNERTFNAGAIWYNGLLQRNCKAGRAVEDNGSMVKLNVDMHNLRPINRIGAVRDYVFDKAVATELFDEWDKLRNLHEQLGRMIEAEYKKGLQ